MEYDSYLESEDILSDSLQTLYDYHPITLTTPGSLFTYIQGSKSANHEHSPSSTITPITLHTPDTAAANWSLHASSIWVSSLYLADHIDDLHLEEHVNTRCPGEDPVSVLELGASAGLPSILIAKCFPATLVTATDYPDEELIKTLSANVERNDVAQLCRVIPYAWGTDPSIVLRGTLGFDVVIAADTLWNPELHCIFINALKATLRKSSTSRVHLVVGLHTGRYTIQSFLDLAQKSGFVLQEIKEKEAAGSITRSWEIIRDDEGEKERRGWVIWMVFAWSRESLAFS
ncbi:hypothetical protein B0H34DRAFT_655096 [Crassisporium funariophilum]|nr:hypothetical protein B0H34DRAFT_655096 [Crassisporium funariophilum]